VGRRRRHWAGRRTCRGRFRPRVDFAADAPALRSFLELGPEVGQDGGLRFYAARPAQPEPPARPCPPIRFFSRRTGDRPETRAPENRQRRQVPLGWPTQGKARGCSESSLRPAMGSAYEKGKKKKRCGRGTPARVAAGGSGPVLVRVNFRVIAPGYLACKEKGYGRKRGRLLQIGDWPAFLP